MTDRAITPVGAVAVPASAESLRPFVEAGVFGAAEVHLAARIATLGGCDDHLVALAVAAATWAARSGHSCADLEVIRDVVDTSLAASQWARTDRPDRDGGTAAPGAAPTWPEPSVWVGRLRSADAGAVVRVVDTWDTEPVLDPRPLVLHGHRVYLQRHWVDECTVAASLRARAVAVPTVLTPGAQDVLDALLPTMVGDTPNLQRAAADVVLGHRLSVIVGGPGTGKTYSVARVLAALLQQGDGRSLLIGLAAPTGKAAARLTESIRVAVAHPDVIARVPESTRTLLSKLTPTTIHRLLGPSGMSRQRFRHDGGNPLPHDVVIIDETSMVDVPLLARLCEAVRPDARLVLIGDPDQLESVDLGAALADVQAAGLGPVAGGPLVGSVTRLERGHRFGATSPIAALADAVRDDPNGGAVNVLDATTDDPPSSVRLVETTNPLGPAVAAEVRAVVAPHLAAMRAAALAGDTEAALHAATAVRVLCAHRRGQFGVSAWNQLGEQWLAAGDELGGEWYAGRPLLVTRNDPRLGLSNGDTGVVVQTGGGPQAVFAAGDGTVTIDPVHLDAVETAFAMTVHKSQGSEYERVVLVLPPIGSPLVGRELLYTGVTRTRSHLLLVGSKDVVRAAAAAPARRMTGLADALRA